MKKQRYYSYEPDVEPLSKRLGRFVLLCGMIFATVAAVVATQRLSTDALGMVLGVLLGGSLLALPIGLVAWVVVQVKGTSRRNDPPAYTIPPIVIQSPPSRAALPEEGLSWDVPLPQQQRHPPRAWEVIGDD